MFVDTSVVLYLERKTTETGDYPVDEEYRGPDDLRNHRAIPPLQETVNQACGLKGCTSSKLEK